MRSFVPQYLHKPNKVMMLDMDEFAVFANAVAMGIILKSLESVLIHFNHIKVATKAIMAS